MLEEKSLPQYHFVHCPLFDSTKASAVRPASVGLRMNYGTVNLKIQTLVHIPSVVTAH